jgi:hypothetical protein
MYTPHVNCLALKLRLMAHRVLRVQMLELNSLIHAGFTLVSHHCVMKPVLVNM